MELFFLEPVTLKFYSWDQDKNLDSMFLFALGYINSETFDTMNNAYSPKENIPIEVYTYYLYLKQRYVTEYTTTKPFIESLIKETVASGRVNGYFLLGYSYKGQSGTIILYIDPSGAYSIEKGIFSDGKYRFMKIPYNDPKSSYYIHTHAPKGNQPNFIWYNVDKPK